VEVNPFQCTIVDDVGLVVKGEATFLRDSNCLDVSMSVRGRSFHDDLQLKMWSCKDDGGLEKSVLVWDYPLDHGSLNCVLLAKLALPFSIYDFVGKYLWGSMLGSRGEAADPCRVLLQRLKIRCCLLSTALISSTSVLLTSLSTLMLLFVVLFVLFLQEGGCHPFLFPAGCFLISVVSFRVAEHSLVRIP
jgi:hypothetical protein